MNTDTIDQIPQKFYIQEVEIDNFWGEKNVKIEFGTRENFLIGVNGSGKTTIINLIAAAIEADFYTLDRVEFDKITIRLVSPAKRKAKIIVQKKEVSHTPFQNILFQIYRLNKKILEINLNDLEEDKIYRYRTVDKYYYSQFSEVPSKKNFFKKDLQHALKTLFNTSWLSIHRSKNKKHDDNYESLVDKKLIEFSSNFTGYINELTRKAKDETDKFQKYIFLSLLSTESELELINTLRNIDITKEKQSLTAVYSLFELKKTEYEDDLNSYASGFSKSLEKATEEGKIDFVDAEHLIGMRRIHSVIQKWQELISKQEVIFESRTNFMAVINELLQKKKMILNERNELIIETESGKKFDLNYLSSGEKQLLIIFGEALLQRSQPHIFIADEPELSLHVEWQEKLVQGLKVLNPYSQMIFATHSPDIVGVYQDSVIKIENCIK